MRSALLSLLLITGAAAAAESAWLTILGDSGDPRVDTIQVDPAPVQVKGDLKTMRVRVSRASDRVNLEGVPYRSFDSNVLFDCGKGTTRYLSVTFYMEPAWNGQVMARNSFAAGPQRPMVFRGVEPNPYRRIIRAVCGRSPAQE